MQILICEDHKFVAAALGSMLKMVFGAQVHIEHSFYSARLLAEKQAFDLCLLDINIPGEEPYENLAAIRARLPDVPMIVFSGSDSDDDLRMTLHLKMQGYLPKSSSPDVVEAAIGLVLAGGSYLPDRVATLAFAQGEPTPPPFARDCSSAVYGSLTPRQCTVLELIAQGQSNKEIAQALSISPATVKMHVAQIIGILGAKNRTGAVHMAQKLGIL